MINMSASKPLFLDPLLFCTKSEDTSPIQSNPESDLIQSEQSDRGFVNGLDTPFFFLYSALVSYLVRSPRFIPSRHFIPGPQSGFAVRSRQFSFYTDQI